MRRPAAAYLIRHAKAEPSAPGGDADRKLTPEGRAAFTRKARRLGPSLELTRILTSPLARARETAAILAEVTGAPVEEDRRLASGASGGAELLALARELREAAGGAVALVGHNPELAEAVLRAAGGDGEVHVPPGTVAALTRDGALAWLA